MTSRTEPAAFEPPATIDRRGRFREIYRAVRADHGATLPADRPAERALSRFGDEPPGGGNEVYLGPGRLPLHVAIVPGLVADCLRGTLSPFTFARDHLRAHGYQSSVIWVNGRAGCAYNAAIIDTELSRRPVGQKLLLIGYSKGVADILQALVSYPQLRRRAAAVVSLAGAVAGSPLAESTPQQLLRLLGRVALPNCTPGDGAGVASLRRAVRRAWLSQHPLPPEPRYFSVVCTPQPERISRILRPSYRRLARESRYNDSQVIYYDALIPDSELLAYVNADHWAVTLPIARVWPITRFAIDQNDYPREVLLESIVRYVEEALLDGGLGGASSLSV